MTNHVGRYIWTQADGSPRPSAHSIEANRRERKRLFTHAELLNTPEGQAYLDRHGFTKLKSEDLDWLTSEAGQEFLNTNYPIEVID